MEKYYLSTGTDGATWGVQRPFFPRLKDFQILEDIAQGGMGIVYKVYDRVERRISALKVLNLSVLLPEEREEEIARFQREAKLALSITHPNMVRAYRMGCEEGIWYYVMEYVPSEDLGEIVDRRGKLEEQEVLPIAIVLADVIAYIADRGLVHRDIKPDNVLIGYDGSIKLCDYGLLRQRKVSPSITSSGISIGTPNYMSPEQARGDEDLDVRSDIYSLGMTLYHLLTGKTPFESSSVTLTLSRHIFEEVPPVRQYEPRVSQELEEILLKMTKKKREERYQDPRHLKRDLQKLYQKICKDSQRKNILRSS